MTPLLWMFSWQVVGCFLVTLAIWARSAECCGSASHKDAPPRRCLCGFQEYIRVTPSLKPCISIGHLPDRSEGMQVIVALLDLQSPNSITNERIRSAAQNGKRRRPQMLVLTRKVGEKICIGNDIVVTVAAIAGNRITLGFQCPSGIPVDREEIRLRINAGKNVLETPDSPPAPPSLVSVS